MSNFFTLIKANLLIFIGALAKKRQKGRYVFTAVMIGFFLLLFGGSMAVQAAAQAYQFVVKMNIPEFAIFVGMITALAISLLFGIMRATTKTTARDADMLLSMPIRKSTVVLSKIASQYVFDAPILIIIFSPTVIATFAFGGIDPGGLIRGLLLALAMPLFSLTVSMLFGFVFSIIREKLPIGNLLMTGVMMGILVVYIVWNMQLSSLYTRVSEMGAQKALAMIEVFPPVRWFTYFVSEGGLVNSLLTMLCIFVPFMLVVFMYARRYGRSQVHWKSGRRTLLFAARTPRRALFFAEVRKYFACSLYVFNTAFGPVLMMVFTVALLVMGPDRLIGLLAPSDGEAFVLSREQLSGILLAMFCFFAAMTMTTAPSISAEGKRFWILRSLPVRTGDIFAAKLGLSAAIFLPLQLIASSLVAMRLGLSLAEVGAFVLLPATLNLSTGGMGLIVNLFFPKLDWRMEVEVFKQSASVFFGMLAGIAMTAIPIVLYFSVFFREGGVMIVAYMSSGIFILVYFAELLFLRFPGKRMFEKISA